MTPTLEKVLMSEPINALAKIVTNQRGCTNSDSLTLEDVKIIIKKLKNRQKEIRGKMGLGRNQYKNRKHHRGGVRQRYNDTPTVRLLLQKAMENGQRIHFFETLLTSFKQPPRGK